MYSAWPVRLGCIQKFLSNKFTKGNILKSRLFCSQSSCKEDNFETFDSVIRKRRTEANRSIIVQVNSEKSFPELYNYCSQFGGITEAQHYTVPHDEGYHYILIEFENETIANDAINSSCYHDDLSGIPVKSRFLWFKACNNGKKLTEMKLSPTQQTPVKNTLKIIDGGRNISENDLCNLLQSATTLEDQIIILHRTTCLNDLGTRLRFLAAQQVECSISGMFPNANARPFGSSVNGFGRMGCDLDLILRFDKEKDCEMKQSSSSRLVFHTKENLSNGRSQVQRQMESIGDMLHLFLPGVSHVRRILQARIPIIKFHHEHLNLEVDLSMSNLTGVYMSELLYMFGKIDIRVRPLVFCLRKWAQSVGLTNPSPGRWITNFSLTCLIIFFLQQLKNPILPPINLLCKSAAKDDVRITEDGINCTFLRDCNNLQFITKNKQNLTELLLEFFEFCSQFDFTNRAISLNEGRHILKPDHSAMHIVNPLEQVLNVTKNVSLEECERLRIEVRNAAWILESEVERTTGSGKDLITTTTTTTSHNHDEPWGLLNLFKTSERAVIRPNHFFKPRMVDVSDLFEDKVARYESEPHKKIEIIDQSIKNQVSGIKAKRKADLRKIRMDAMAGGGSQKRKSR